MTTITATDTYVVTFTDTTPGTDPLDCDYEVSGRTGVTNAMGMIVRDYLNTPTEDGMLDPELVADMVATTERILEDFTDHPDLPLASSSALLEKNLSELKRTSAILDFLTFEVVGRIGDLDPDETVTDPVMASLVDSDVSPTLQNVLLTFLLRLETQGYRFDITEAFVRV